VAAGKNQDLNGFHVPEVMAG